MATLLVTLDGPMQSWGASSKFANRGTESAPTKSGVLGLVAAAKGIRRTEPLTELSGIRFGVRSDQPGQMMRDFQTARTLDGKTSMPLSQRYYLGDAVFLAALEHEDDGLLRAIQNELKHPVFPLYLGRRSCPPSGPVRTELVTSRIERAFTEATWRAKPFWRKQHSEFEHVYVETRIDRDPDSDQNGTTVSVQDVPLSFDPERRLYAWRDVALSGITVVNPDFAPSDRSEPQGVKQAGADEIHDHDVLGDWPEGEA